MYSKKFRIIILFFSGFFILFYTFLEFFQQLSISNVSKKENNYVSNSCLIQPPDPWDPTIKDYISSDNLPTVLTCEKSNIQPELSYLDENGFLYLNHTLINELSLEIQCKYRVYDKIDGDDENLNYSHWINFNNSKKISNEFVEVKCNRLWFPHSNIYTNNHNQIIPIQSDSESISNNQYPSVIIIVLDSVSHSNFRRNMNKTFHILQTHYNSTIFDGMTKVGDNSFNNAVAFFAGKWSETEFGNVHGFFDDHDLIWKHYQKMGYRTFYAEDYPGFNLFNYLSKGFRKKPVDHYFSRNLCYGNKPMHKLQLNYLSQFLKKYKKSPKFAVSWFTELGHDWLNQIRYGDKDLSEFLINHQSILENSFLFLMSDHGHRFDTIRRTTVGRIEERLPFFSLTIPKSHRQNESLTQILEMNSKKMTTFWDVYETFLDILYKKSISSRGTSLLRPVQDRNCAQASIPEEFCVCESESNIPIDKNKIDEKLIYLAEGLVKEINQHLAKFPQCAKLFLQRVFTASQVGDSLNNNYRITLEVLPSLAIFEALMKTNTNNDDVQIIGDINRINKYGNQSICVNDQFLRKLCYCV